MRPYGIDLRWKSLFTLFAISSATLSTVPARADVFVPPYTPSAAPPPTSAASTKPKLQPIELREVILSGRQGQLTQAQVPLQGGKLLLGADFYRAVNREDLARSYEARTAWRAALVVGGLLSMIAGAATLNSTMNLPQCHFAPMPYPYSPQQVVCPPNSNDGTIAVGIGLMALGPVLMFGTLAISPDPVSPAERQTLVDTYNASLGPPTAEAAPAHPHRAAVSLAVEPTVSATGAGLTLGGRF